ncbi:flagellar basal-body rod protein FlgC [Geothrix oryzae]|jgi:flagellar basal-body rod protein FlgC|uniref:Flagellar basal-body rod protein FlgC n=1 Tax=Geothrix oryzae TaxID=2927975 RepID=A0ABM8DNK9_9BACT|nr:MULTISPECIES: flagellar basal body rod protein FlgC [Geothrix]BDU68537.1 flagellar basal-body rod protein FlgC [Geothrix oryzae]
MSIPQILDIASTGMAAQRLRVQLIASNIANSETTRTKEGGPYRRKDAVFQSENLGFSGALAAAGVKVASIQTSQEPFLTRLEPGHPDADADGVVSYPNVNPVEEMVNLTEASRAYEANIAVVRAAKTMATSALEILRVQ